GNKLEGTEAGARVEINPLKKNPADFALWKKIVGRNKKHLLRWESPWGEGFPGWHIECSAMAFRYLGETIDIHTGGRDNIFPHHESEIAQSEAFSGRQFSRFWLHSGLVEVNGKKMSKSLGNFYTLADIEQKGFDPLIFRLWALSANYRKEINFSWKKLAEIKLNWQKIVDFQEKNWQELIENKQVKSISQKDLRSLEALWTLAKKNSFYFKLRQFVKERDRKFCEAMNDDLNTSVAFSVLLETLKLANKKPILSIERVGALILLKEWDRVLAFLPKIKIKKRIEGSKKVEELLRLRQKAKETGDYKKADDIREKIESRGYKIVDLSNGQWKVKKIK
ncbi:MAG: class I tRNA ligase family protein, partial [Bacteroidetes bacterium]|nr:class I tRNA ligase family protein [Bacteroidota bacterium]